MAKFNGMKIIALLGEIAEIASEDDNYVPNGQEVEKLAEQLFDKGGLETVGVKPSQKAKGIVSSIRSMISLGLF